MSIADYLENKILDKVCRNTDFTVSGVYVKLHLGDPGEDCTSNPAVETTRQQATFGDAAASGTIANTVAITWTSVSTTETYSHVSLWDASSGGNALLYGALSASKAVTAGDNFTIPIGDLDVSMS